VSINVAVNKSVW